MPEAARRMRDGNGAFKTVVLDSEIPPLRNQPQMIR
jgi:hypothetical protein